MSPSPPHTLSCVGPIRSSPNVAPGNKAFPPSRHTIDYTYKTSLKLMLWQTFQKQHFAGGRVRNSPPGCNVSQHSPLKTRKNNIIVRVGEYCTSRANGDLPYVIPGRQPQQGPNNWSIYPSPAAKAAKETMSRRRSWSHRQDTNVSLNMKMRRTGRGP